MVDYTVILIKIIKAFLQTRNFLFLNIVVRKCIKWFTTFLSKSQKTEMENKLNVYVSSSQENNYGF